MRTSFGSEERRWPAIVRRTTRRLERLKPSASIDDVAVKNAYRRWAPVYDRTFGRIAAQGRLHAVDAINRGKGRVLEVGVGTGLSLPAYAPHLEISGIDLSPEMLEKARERVAEDGLDNVVDLREMDAGNLDYADESFETVVAMYVITVVPEPDKVMRELARVCAPGGRVILVNHFSQEAGVRGWVERAMAPFADVFGWHPLFDKKDVMICDELELIKTRALRPMGLFTMLQFEKRADLVPQTLAAE